MKVYKFGGTSVGTVERMKHVAELISESTPKIVVLSATAGTTNHLEVVAAVEASELKGKVKIMVGGAPVNDAFAKAIGADAYTSNANAAVVMAKKLIAAN